MKTTALTVNGWAGKPRDGQHAGEVGRESQDGATEPALQPGEQLLRTGVATGSPAVLSHSGPHSPPFRQLALPLVIKSLRFHEFSRPLKGSDFSLFLVSPILTAEYCSDC